MTDTATNPKRTQKPRNVNYELEVVDDLPDNEIVRRSPLEDQIEKIVATEAAHRRWVRIASYANGSAASAAANVLRQRHGDKAAVDGWEVRPKRVDTEDGPRTGLFVKYDPDAIVDGARADFERREDLRKAKIAKKRAEREGNGQASDQTPREEAKGAGKTSGTADAAGAKSPASKR